MNKLNLSFACLVETRANEERVIHFCNKFTKKWEWVVIPSWVCHAAGVGEWEIIILWKKRFGKITPVAFSHFTLYLVISSDKSKDWIMSVVYNAQNFHVQHDAWNSLS